MISREIRSARAPDLQMARFDLPLSALLQCLLLRAVRSLLLMRSLTDATIQVWSCISVRVAQTNFQREEQLPSDNNLTGLPECDTILNTLVPHFGVIPLYRVASKPNITPNLQRTLLGNHNTSKSIEVERSTNPSTVCSVRTIQLGCSNLL